MHQEEKEVVRNNYKLLTVSKWNDHHIWPSQSGLRHLIFSAKENGFDRVIKRVGRRVLIDEQAFYQWIEEQNK